MKVKPTLLLLVAVLIAIAGKTQKPSFRGANFREQTPRAQTLSQRPSNIGQEFMQRMYNESSGRLSYDRLNGTVTGSSSYAQSMVSPRSNIDLNAYKAEQTIVEENRLLALPGPNTNTVTGRSDGVTSSSGYPDSSFNGKGWTTTPIFKGNARSQEDGHVLVLKDGRYIVVFRMFDKTLLARYLPGGELDKTFGTNGFSNYVNITLNQAVLQSDEKIIVVGGYNGNSFTLARFSYNGTLDKSFGADGIASAHFDSFVGFPTATVGYDGKIVLVSYSFNAVTNNYDFILARFNGDGSLDSSFDNDGKLATDFFGTNDFGNAVAVQRDGRIVVSGNALNPNTGYRVFAIARYKRDGKLDNSFGDEGKVTTDFGSGASGNAIAVQKDNKIVVAGVALNTVTGNSDMAVACYKSNGKPDESFDEDGRLTTDFGVYLLVPAVALEGGKIVVEGMTYSGHYDNIAFARYNTNGSLDDSFDGDGKLVSDFGSFDFSRSLAIQKDGKIVIGGDTYNFNAGNYDFVLARYNADGSPDESFNQNGLLIAFYPSNSGTYFSTALQKDGKLVAAGNGFNAATGYDDFLARYNTDGSLDNSFGTEGKVVIDFGGAFEFAVSTVIQSDGKILVAGDGSNPSTGATEICVARFNPDGSPDNSFGKDGMVRTGVSGGAYPFAIKVQNNGKIVVAGYAFDTITFGVDFAVVRYNPDGSLDNSFDGDGIQTTDFGQDEYATSLALQSDGKLVLAGYYVDNNTYTLYFALARYNTDGSLDNTFDADGKTITDFGPYSVANAIAVQQDGKILAAGSAIDANFFSADFALARYNPDGTLDNSFNGDGKLTTSFCPGDATGFCSDDMAYSVALQGNGKILVAGNTTDYNTFTDIALARYNEDGTPDDSFDDDGMLTTDLGGFESIYSSAWHKGKLYVVGGYGTFGTEALVAVYLTKTKAVLNNSIAAAENSSDLKIKNTNTAFDAMLSPNPVHHVAALQIKGNAKDVTVAIADMNGRIVLQGRYNNQTKINLPVEKLSSGIYLVTIKSGNASRILKLVKE